MSASATHSLRNLGIVAHIDAGKTTLAERILFFTGAVRRMGEVHEGNTVLDWLEEERERGITIQAAATRVEWRGHPIHLVDTPGHVDFTVEVERCTRVLDGAVLVLNATAGVQAQTETVVRQLARHRVPTIVFVNQCDRPGADVLRCAAQLRTRLQLEPALLELPLGREHDFRGVYQVLEGRALEFDARQPGAAPRPVEAPAELAELGALARNELAEKLAEHDDAVLLELVEGRVPSSALLQAALRVQVIAGRLVPVLCGAALRNIGIQPLLDALVDYLPAPDERPPTRGVDPRDGRMLERRAQADEPLAALVFKIEAQAHESLYWTRIYSGRLASGERVLNPRTGERQRVTRMLRLHADQGSLIEAAGPGEICALSGLRGVRSGDTLCAPEAPIALESLVFPQPVISQVLEPQNADEREKLRLALGRLLAEDPSLGVREDPDTGQWLLSGMGELHLEVARHRLKREFKLEPRIGQQRVAYREALSARARGRGEIDRLLAGEQLRACVEVQLEPLEAPGELPLQFAEGLELGLRERAALAAAVQQALSSGPRFGFLMRPLQVRILRAEAGADHDRESGFAAAAALALRAALQEAAAAGSVTVEEPEMDFEVLVPEEFGGGVVGDLQARGAILGEVASEGSARVLRGRVALSQVFGYSTALRSLTQGRGAFSLRLAGFRAVGEEQLKRRGLTWH